MRTGWRQRMNGAFEAVKRLCLPFYYYLKGFVIFIARNFRTCPYSLLSCRPALASPRGLFSRPRALGSRTPGRSLAAEPATLARRRVVFLLAPAGAALLAAVSFLVDGGPCAPFSFMFGHASTLITLFDMF